MKKFIASVTYEGQLELIEREYKTKKAFYNDLRGNGYSVRFIATEETFDDECEKWHERNERSKRIQKAIYACNKEFAEKMNMTVSQYKAWLKG